MKEPIIIIGTGLAGYNLAKEIRKLDTETPLCLITQDDGCFYSKPQLSSSFGHNKLPDDLPLADVNKMRTQLDADIHTYTEVTAVEPDAHAVRIGDKTLSYSQLVFANGACVLPEKFSGDALNDLIRVNNLEDYRRFNTALSGKKTVAVIGAGLVGTEFALDLTTAGFDVHVIAMGKTPLDRFMPEACGEVVQAALAEKGIHWHLGQAIKAIHHDGNAYAVVAENETVNADVVLVAIGITPDVRLAKAAGLTVNKGIVVDDTCQSSHPDIYALGDCAEMSGVVRHYTAPILAAARGLAKTLTGTKTAVTIPVTPVVVKTPVHPIVMALPNNNQTGVWAIEIADKTGSKALFKSGEQLLGFVLTGACAVERQALLTQLKR